MAATSLNRYKGIFKNMGQQSVVAQNAQTAAGLFMEAEADQGLLTTIQLLEEGIMVETPPLYTDFVAFVTPSLAMAQGAWASPSKWRVPVGSNVLFEVKVPEGWTFQGWFIDDAATPAAETPLAELTIPAQVTPDATIRIEARLIGPTP